MIFRKTSKTIIIFSLLVLPAFSLAADQNILRWKEATVEDNAIGKAVDSDPGYIFHRGSAFGDNQDVFYRSGVIMQDEAINAIAGSYGCNFIDFTGSSKVFSANTVLYSSGLPISSGTACLLVNRGPANNLVTGNIYSGGKITNQFLLRQGVGVSGDAVQEGIDNRVSGYRIDSGSTAQWDSSKEYKNVFMLANILKWRDQRAREFKNDIKENFHLNPQNSDKMINNMARPSNDNYPNGRTWYHKGDLNISGGNLVYRGIGTIIVEGNLKIDVTSLKPYTTDKNALGFIVLPNSIGGGGNVEITSNVNDLQASFFIPGKTNSAIDPDSGLPSSGLFTIRGGDSKLEITGSIVAAGIDMREQRLADEGNYGIIILYDDKLASIPLPGFTREMRAKIEEQAP